MIATSQEFDGFNSKEDLTISSDPFIKPSDTLQSSEQALKVGEKSQEGQLSCGLIATRSTADSSLSTLNKKTDDIMLIENRDQYAVGQVQDESGLTVSGPFKRVTTDENVSVVKKKGRQSSKKEETRVKKNAPQKKKNSNFVKKSPPKTKKRASKNKNALPQSPYKNSYKAIFCEILSYIQFFCNPDAEKCKKVLKEAAKSDEKWKVDSENARVLAQAKTQEDTKSETDFIRWLEANKTNLEDAIEDQRYVKLLPLKDLIKESKGLINETDCRTHFEKRKGCSVNKSQGEGMKLTWLLIVTFSLVWLPKEPEGETLKLFPVQKHTVGLLSWLVSSRTQVKGKKILNNSEDRRHIREEMIKKFTTLYNSALSEFPSRKDWLKKLDDIVKETESAQSTTETEPDTIMNEQVQSNIPDLQTVNVSTACSEASFQDSKHAQDSFSAQSFALDGFKEIKYDKTKLIDCALGSKLGFNCAQLIPMKFFEGLEDSYYQLERDLYEKTGSRDDVGQSQNVRNSFDELDAFTSFNEEQLVYAKEFRWNLTGKRFKFLFDVNGYDDGYFDFKKKFKKM